MEGAEDISEHETNIAGQGLREDGGQSGECVVGADSDAGNGAIGEDKYCGEGIDMLFNLSRNTLLVKLVLLHTASVGQPRRVKDADLRRGLYTLVMFTMANTYYYAILAFKLVKARRVGLALVARTASLVGMVENVRVAIINVIAGKDISYKLKDRRFSNTSFPNKKDSVWRLRLIF